MLMFNVLIIYREVVAGSAYLNQGSEYNVIE